MNKKYAKLLVLLLVATMMITALLGCKAKEEPVTMEPTAEATDAPAAVEPEAPENEPTQDAPAETEPEEEIIVTEPEVDAPEPGSITYEEYLALEVEVQQAYYDKFETPDDFFAWFNAAKAEQEAATEPTEVIGSESDSSEDVGIVDDTFNEESVEVWE